MTTETEQPDFIPFGKEWEAEMKKLPKGFIIEQFKKARLDVERQQSIIEEKDREIAKWKDQFGIAERSFDRCSDSKMELIKQLAELREALKKAAELINDTYHVNLIGTTDNPKEAALDYAHKAIDSYKEQLAELQGLADRLGEVLQISGLWLIESDWDCVNRAKVAYELHKAKTSKG